MQPQKGPGLAKKEKSALALKSLLIQACSNGCFKTGKG
jgi:hypothetical protein